MCFYFYTYTIFLKHCFHFFNLFSVFVYFLICRYSPSDRKLYKQRGNHEFSSKIGVGTTQQTPVTWNGQQGQGKDSCTEVTPELRVSLGGPGGQNHRRRG